LVLVFGLSGAPPFRVAQTYGFILHNKRDWFIGILIAVCWGTITLFVLRALFPDKIELPQSLTPNLTVFLAAIIMGIGAFLNRGCFIGTIGRISSGDLAYLFTFAGLGVSSVIGRGYEPMGTLVQHHRPRLSPDSGPIFWVILGVVGLIAAWSVWRRYRRRQQAILALSVVGVSAILLFVARPDWSYEGLIGRLATGQGTSENFVVELTVLSLFAGAIISSFLNSKFQLRFTGIRKAILSFVGGALMGLGAMYVPGGNDTLLLWVIPGFAAHGLFAYLTMVAVVAILMPVAKRFM
jgi:hypothetical protein